jgi:hypothetical protein
LGLGDIPGRLQNGFSGVDSHCFAFGFDEVNEA